MNIQEKFDNITKIQKLLLYNISFLLFIFSFIFLVENEEEIGYTILLLGFIYLDILLFFEFKYVVITKNKIINTLKLIRKIVFYLFIILVLIYCLAIIFVKLFGTRLF